MQLPTHVKDLQRLIMLCILPCLWAPAAVSATNGDTFSGHFAVGYRDVDVSGDEAKYDQHINLDDGARLFDLGFVFQPQRDESSPADMPDRVEFNASGLGGDPYESLQLRIKKYGAYRFKYDRRSSDYFYEDLLLLPEDASIEGSTGGDFHHFDFERVRDSLDLDIDLNDRATLSLGFDRHDKNGDSTTTLDVEREEFELDKPIDETLEAYNVGLRYGWDKVTLTITERWQDYDNASSAFLPGFSPGTDPTEPTELDFFFLDQPYGYDAREHQVNLRLRPDKRWDIQLNARLSDLDLDMQANERAQGLDFIGAPFTTDVTGSADIDRDTQLYDLAVSYAVSDRLLVTASVRQQNLDQDGTLQFGTVDGISSWEIDTTGFELGVDVALNDALTLAAGWSNERRDTSFGQESEGIVVTEDVETDRDGFYAHLSYRPNRNLQVTFSAETNSIDDPFTLASATDSQRYRLRARYRWDNGLTLNATYRRTEYENDNSGWESDTEQTDVRLTYSTDRLTVSVGAALVDLQRDIDQLVTGGFRQDLFAISYAADADFWDGSVRWRLTDRIDLAASYRTYDNDGSFSVDRDDARAAVEVALPDNYGLQLSYRNVDYEEDQLESFDVDIWEVALKYRW
jgi:predicted porin